MRNPADNAGFSLLQKNDFSLYYQSTTKNSFKKKPLEIKNTIYRILPNKKTKIPMIVNMLLTPIIALPTSIFLVFFFTLFSTEIRYVHKKRLRH